ncbi:MAG: two-component system, OmpR family, phosphate regulon sensor histidine kinase PhoR [Pyrinomonadaceae bacterium]|nr:two-component system, OmpR family, phosphate regulon sensor histidine kinase PhoR [Pyrinomonadaceae bacterium]
MSKRNAILIAAAAVLFAALFLLPSFAARASAAAFTLLGAVFLLAKTFSTRSGDKNLSASGAREATNGEGSPNEIFALGKLFEATMTGMREGLLVVDQEMRVVASNPAAHRLFNLSGGQLNSQRLTQLTRNPAMYSAFLDALQGKERSGVKVETHGPERLIFDLHVVPLNSSNGRSANRPGGTEPAAPQGALGVFIDVTRIERLERVRQEFLSNISHELRTPLTSILAFVETLETSALEDQESAKHFLTIIRKNAVRMNTLISDIIELSAIESGNVKVRAEQVALSPLVTEVISFLAAQAEARPVTVVNEVTADIVVFADARRLEQMLTNLIDNAIKFNREGGKVTVKFERSSRDQIMIEDTGEGIPAQYLDRLFERFYRVDRARSREVGGTGLGLAIVKHLARAHGGEASVTSEVGKGSTFIIELPRND